MDYILLKNGKVKEIKRKAKIKYKNKEVTCVLVSVYSDILGKFYYALSYNIYKSLTKNIKSFNLKYKFLHGEHVNSDDDYMFSKYEYHLNNLSGLLCKLTEIFISEYSLNSYVWLNSSERCYCYDDISIKIKYKNKKKNKRFNINKFIDKFDIFKEIIKYDKQLIINNNKFSYVKTINKLKGNMNLLHLYGSIFVEAGDELSKISKIKRHSILYMNDCYDEIIEEKSNGKNKRDWFELGGDSFEIDFKAKDRCIKDLRYLFEIPMSHFILEQAISDYNIKITEKIKVKISSKTKKIKYWKLLNKCFKLS